MSKVAELPIEDLAKIAKASRDFYKGAELIRKGNKLIDDSGIGSVEYKIFKDKPAMIVVFYRGVRYEIRADLVTI